MASVAQQIVTFSPDYGFVPENASEFFAAEVQQKWLDLVPRRCPKMRCIVWENRLTER